MLDKISEIFNYILHQINWLNILIIDDKIVVADR